MFALLDGHKVICFQSFCESHIVVTFHVGRDVIEMPGLGARSILIGLTCGNLITEVMLTSQIQDGRGRSPNNSTDVLNSHI